MRNRLYFLASGIKLTAMSAIEIEIPFAQGVVVTNDALQVSLTDGRSISVPLGWYPRLVNGTDKERGTGG